MRDSHAKHNKKAIKVTVVSFLFLSVIWTGIGFSLYQLIFGRLYEASQKPFPLTISDFPDLSAEPVIFKSGRNMLKGNFYCSRLITHKDLFNHLLKPVIDAIEIIKFGKYTKYSGFRGINKTKAHVLAFYSKDDPIVAPSNALVF